MSKKKTIKDSTISIIALIGVIFIILFWLISHINAGYVEMQDYYVCPGVGEHSDYKAHYFYNFKGCEKVIENDGKLYFAFWWE